VARAEDETEELWQGIDEVDELWDKKEKQGL
jgi:hypothetical protein